MRKLDVGLGREGVGVKSVIGSIIDSIEENAVWHIRRYKNEADKKAQKIYSNKEALALFGAKQHTEIIGNALVNQGINEMWTVLCSATGQAWDNANAVLIVGTGTGAENPADTRATFTLPVEKAMDGGYPTFGTLQKAIWRATYASGDANQAWEEFGVLNTITTGELMNRKISSQGTKIAGQVWELTLEITLT